jgi:hypothetical protein
MHASYSSALTAAACAARLTTQRSHSQSCNAGHRRLRHAISTLHWHARQRLCALTVLASAAGQGERAHEHDGDWVQQALHYTLRAALALWLSLCLHLGGSSTAHAASGLTFIEDKLLEINRVVEARAASALTAVQDGVSGRASEEVRVRGPGINEILPLPTHSYAVKCPHTNQQPLSAPFLNAGGSTRS